MQEPKHILKVLQQTKEAVKKQDSIKLKELSNQTIHSASIHQDAESIMVAVVIYSLSKILERTHYQRYGSWQRFFKSFMRHIDHTISALNENNQGKFRKELKKIRKEINNLTGHFKKHIQDVFKKASINKASKIYEHGISMEKTAKLLGITLWELAEYTGQTSISDVNLNATLPIKERIKTAMGAFS
jgi:ribosomal protein S15P/S13E